MLLKQTKYFHAALYSAHVTAPLASSFLVLAGESVMLHCDSRPLCSAAHVWDASHARSPREWIQKLQEMKKTLILYHRDELDMQRDSFNYLLCNVVSYQMCSINCSSSVSPRETVVLQMLHVAAGLLSLSTWSYFHTADIWSTGLQSNFMCTSELKKKKKKNQALVHVQNCRSWSVEKCPYQPRSCRSDQDIPNHNI